MAAGNRLPIIQENYNPANFRQWLERRQQGVDIVPPPDSTPIYEELKKRPKSGPVIVEIKPMIDMKKRAKELDALLTPEVLAQWQVWREAGKTYEWIAARSGIAGLTGNTVRTRLLKYQKATNTPPVVVADPFDGGITAVVPIIPNPQPTTMQPLETNGLGHRIAAFRDEMTALGVRVEDISISLHLVKEVRV